jgi:hypothetical protein
MEMNISIQFTILSLHPLKGRIVVSNTNFRYALAGACLMDLYLKGEISEENKRVIHSLNKSGDLLHDRISDIIGASSRPRRISFWIRKISWKSRQNLKDSVSILVSNGSLRHEKHYFLGLFPYNRYYFNDQGLRGSLVEKLREVVIAGKTPTDEQMMLLGLMKVSRSLRRLANENGERSIIRARVREVFSNNDNISATERFVRLVMSAVSNAITAAEASYGA